MRLVAFALLLCFGLLSTVARAQVLHSLEDHGKLYLNLLGFQRVSAVASQRGSLIKQLCSGFFRRRCVKDAEGPLVFTFNQIHAVIAVGKKPRKVLTILYPQNSSVEIPANFFLALSVAADELRDKGEDSNQLRSLLLPVSAQSITDKQSKRTLHFAATEIATIDVIEREKTLTVTITSNADRAIIYHSDITLK